ncbi:DUF3048 C-terminal domain-containing protein [Tenuibacillus multivorans]|uniref:DUF3048 C-terminal domain-containing protein n=1 Tax=Tenuibacillus multivorans TaxID=237069 RepID=UPI0015A004C0|nr:DUF3048 C-terminal domain-containing protein [Tenuibacillus multivorans]
MGRYNNFTHVAYKYDSQTKLYSCYLEEEPHAVRESGEQIKTSNVIVIYAKQLLIPGDKAGRINID